MSRICQICQKGYQRSKLVPRGVGNRVTKRTGISRMPNLRVKRFLIDGVKTKFILCASCLKRIKKDSRDLQIMAEAKVQASAAVAK